MLEIVNEDFLTDMEWVDVDNAWDRVSTVHSLGYRDGHIGLYLMDGDGDWWELAPTEVDLGLKVEVGVWRRAEPEKVLIPKKERAIFKVDLTEDKDKKVAKVLDGWIKSSKKAKKSEKKKKCRSCGGTKSYLEPGDLHRSEGWVPCYRCDAEGYEKE